MYFELLPRNQTINSDVYCRELDKLNSAIPTRILIVKLLYYTTSDVTSTVRPDLAPSDYHVFRALQNSLNGITFNGGNAVKLHLDHFLCVKKRPATVWT